MTGKKAGSAVHYSGPLRYTKTDGRTTDVLGGWAACCSGGRAVAIREAGNHDAESANVTCGSCRKLLEKSGAPKWAPDDVVQVVDPAAEMLGRGRWQPAVVLSVFFEDAWWVRVRLDGGRVTSVGLDGVR